LVRYPFNRGRETEERIWVEQSPGSSERKKKKILGDFKTFRKRTRSAAGVPKINVKTGEEKSGEEEGKSPQLEYAINQE